MLKKFERAAQTCRCGGSFGVSVFFLSFFRCGGGVPWSSHPSTGLSLFFLLSRESLRPQSAGDPLVSLWVAGNLGTGQIAREIPNKPLSQLKAQRGNLFT